MTFANYDWVSLIANWLPMLLIVAVWFYYIKKVQRGGGLGGYQKRSAEALERIADALEKRV